MYNSATYKPKAIRFRHFTSKRYATFCSLHKEVSIGCVCAEICDKQLHKSGKTAEYITLPTQKTADRETDTADLPSLLQNNILCLLTEQNSTDLVAQGQYFHAYILLIPKRPITQA